jgi:hypothetical protein
MSGCLDSELDELPRPLKAGHLLPLCQQLSCQRMAANMGKKAGAGTGLGTRPPMIAFVSAGVTLAAQRKSISDSH